MILSSRSKSAGGQDWHKAKVHSGGIRMVGIPKPSWLHTEKVPEEDLVEKDKRKQEVREQALAVDESMVTVVPEGKRAKRRR